MWLWTQELHTKRVNAVPGLVLDRRLDTPSGRRYLRNKFGNDVIVEVDPRNPAAFFKLTGADGAEDVQKQFCQLKELSEQQAQKIKTLEKENEALKRQVRRYKPQEGATDA